MNFRLTLTLTIVLLLVVSGWLYVTSRPKEEPKAVGPTPLLPTTTTGISSISYIRDGSEEVSFVKAGEQWMMAKPVKAVVEKYTVQNIADDLKSMGYRQKFDPEPTGSKSASATGTERPRNIVKFTDEANHEYTLALGKATVDGVYATLNGGKTIYLIDKNPVPALDQDPDKFRDKLVKEIDTAKITALKVVTPENTVTLSKSGDKWLVTSPISARANEATITEILNEFRTIRANSFVKLSPEVAGLTQPVASVTAYVQDTPPATSTAPATASASNSTQPAGTPVTLLLGVYTDVIKKNAVYAGIAGLPDVFTLRSESLTKLNRTLQDLRDTAISPAPVASATEFTVTPNGQTPVNAVKKDGKWALTSPVAVAGDSFAIGDFLGVLRDMRAIRFLDNAGSLSSIGLDPPQVKIDLVVPGQSQHEIILVGKPENDDKGGKVTPVMRQGEPTVYLVQTADTDRLVATPIALRDKTVAEFTADKIRGITVAGSAAPGNGLDLERDGTKWNVKNGATSTPADEVKISSLLADFTPLAAAKYLEPVPPTSAPALTVTLSLLESTQAPATAPATQAGTQPALPTAAAMGPDPGKITTHTLRLYKQETPSTAPAAGTQPAAPTVTWKAVYDGQSPAWTFQPNAALVDHLTKEIYAVPATQPATQPAATVPAH